MKNTITGCEMLDLNQSLQSPPEDEMNILLASLPETNDEISFTSPINNTPDVETQATSINKVESDKFTTISSTNLTNINKNIVNNVENINSSDTLSPLHKRYTCNKVDHIKRNVSLSSSGETENNKLIKIPPGWKFTPTNKRSNDQVKRVKR